MRRREFIAGLGAAAWPVTARAQQNERVRRVGVLYPGLEDPISQERLAALRHGLAQLGWVEGRNLQIDTRYGPQGQLSDRAAELVRSAPDVIVVGGGEPTRAVQQRTHIIPIVFVSVGDPTENGVVKNIAHPEGNASGFTNLFGSFGGKWVELLKRVAPQISRIAIVRDPVISGQSYATSIEMAVNAMGIKLAQISSTEIDHAIPAFAAQPNGGLLVMPARPNKHLANLAIEHKLPSIGSGREDAAVGTLLSYGSNRVDLFRDAASYVDRILRGTKVTDLPVQFPTKFELVVNRKTARAIGLTIPESFLLLVDEIIE
jgi:putative tryptophan/tyrosine transport system substrate-binding protein